MGRQGLAGNLQFSQGAIKIAVAAIKMLCPCVVRFAGIWTDAKCFLDGCLRHGQARRSTVVLQPIELVMSKGELAIRLKKRWVARHGSVQQIDCLPKIRENLAAVARGSQNN